MPGGSRLKPTPSGKGTLRPQLADARRPVGDRGTDAVTVGRPATRTEQVVTGAADEERPAPVGVAAGAADVLAGDPDRVTVDGSGAVVAPPGPNRVGEVLGLVARETVVRSGSLPAGDDVNVPCTDLRVHRRVAGARIGRVAGDGEG